MNTEDASSIKRSNNPGNNRTAYPKHFGMISIKPTLKSNYGTAKRANTSPAVPAKTRGSKSKGRSK